MHRAMDLGGSESREESAEERATRKQDRQAKKEQRRKEREAESARKRRLLEQLLDDERAQTVRNAAAAGGAPMSPVPEAGANPPGMLTPHSEMSSPDEGQRFLNGKVPPSQQGLDISPIGRNPELIVSGSGDQVSFDMGVIKQACDGQDLHVVFSVRPGRQGVEARGYQEPRQTTQEATPWFKNVNQGMRTAKVSIADGMNQVAEKMPLPEEYSTMSVDNKLVGYCAIVILLYFVFGIIAFTQFEDWSFVDALYFCIVTLTTVGYGDLLPTSDGAKVFTMFFVLFGIGLIGSALGIVSGYLMDKQEELAEDMAEDLGLDDNDDSNDCIKSPALKELLKSSCITFFFIMIGVIFYALEEDLRFVDAMYMSVITMTTVGYGDFSPQSQGGRVFAIFWILFGVLAVTRAISDVINIFMERRQKRKEEALLKKKITMQELLANAGDDAQLDMSEFCILKLQSMGKITVEEIDHIKGTFKEMDKDGSGLITAKDLKIA